MNRKGILVFFISAILALTVMAGDPQVNPLLDAKEGEWAIYDLEGQMQLKLTILDVTGEVVTIRMESTRLRCLVFPAS